MNLTPWCNLFSSGLKHKITLGPSRYKTIIYGAIVCLPVLVAAYVFYQNLYLVAILSGSFIFISVAVLSTPPVILSTINQINKNSRANIAPVVIYFKENHVAFEQQYYPLLSCSRISFLGCWLVYQVTDNIAKGATEGKVKKHGYFIFSDSLSLQDYSRLTATIAQLKEINVNNDDFR